MINKLQIEIALITICLLLSVASGANAGRLTVVASVFPLYEFAREVAGTEADVRLLLPPGVDPHSWEPKPSDIIQLSQADIFLYTSDKMEPWAGTFARTVRKKIIISIDVMDSLGFSRSDEKYGQTSVVDGDKDHGEDPHFWLNLSHSAQAVQMIGRTLAESDPENADLYAFNTRAYAGRIEDLDEAYNKGLKNCGSRQLVTGGHAAFGHLARRYGLEQTSVYGLSPDAEPSPKHLAGIVNVVKEKNIRTVFSEELMNPRMTEVLSQETGTRIMTLNPGGNLTAEQWISGVTFIDIMKTNLDTLKEGLDCD